MCIDEIMSRNDDVKPTIARIMFDSYPTIHKVTSHKDLPYECVSSPGNYVLDGFPLQDSSVSMSHEFTTYAHTGDNLVSPTITTAIRNINEKYNELPWDPGLNSITEETVYDLAYQDETLQQRIASTRKRNEYRKRCERKHYDKIAKAIGQSNGIYRVHLDTAKINCKINSHTLSIKVLNIFINK